MSQELNNLNNLENLYEILSKLKSELELDNENPNDLFESLMDSSFEEMDKELIKNSQTKKIKIKKLHPDATIPFYNYPSDSGFDIFSIEDISVTPFGRALVPTGLSFQFDKGYEVQIRTKSGLAINQGLIVLNSPGTVDQGYSGEIKVPVFNTNPTEFKITKGMKVGQAVLCPVINGEFVRFEEVSELNETDRKDKGFGSTGI